LSVKNCHNGDVVLKQLGTIACKFADTNPIARLVKTPF